MAAERRAAIVFCALTWVAVAVAAVAEYAVHRIDAASARLIERDQPALAAILRIETDLQRAQLALAAARFADSPAARRSEYAAYALHTARALERLPEVRAWSAAYSHVADLVRAAADSQRAWSTSARALLQALESGAGPADVESRWRDVVAEHRLASRLFDQVAGAGITPILAGDRIELAKRADESRALIVAVLALGIALSALIIGRTIQIIRHRKRAEDAESEYRDFDRRMHRALQLTETEPEVLEVVHRALDQGLGAKRRAELIMADSSRSKVRRLVSSTCGDEWRGCQVATPQGCPTMRRNTRMVFPSNRSFETCSYLGRDEAEPCSAACVPVSILGHTVGVLHVIGSENALPSADEMRKLDSIALKAGDKLGLVRTFTSKDLLANTDTLTGLSNRRALAAQVPAVIEAHETFSVVYCDLDHFKKLNDAHGHDSGDKAIRLFAEVLRATLRPSDLLARWGGEEFVLVLPGSGMHDAVHVLERLRIRLKERVEHSGLPQFTVSFGVSDSSKTSDFEVIVGRADEALLRAKQNGRDRIERDGDWVGDATFVEAKLAAVGPAG